jgi:hypothetical protein
MRIFKSRVLSCRMSSDENDSGSVAYLTSLRKQCQPNLAFVFGFGLRTRTESALDWSSCTELHSGRAVGGHLHLTKSLGFTAEMDYLGGRALWAVSAHRDAVQRASERVPTAPAHVIHLRSAHWRERVPPMKFSRCLSVLLFLVLVGMEVTAAAVDSQLASRDSPGENVNYS